MTQKIGAYRSHLVLIHASLQLIDIEVTQAKSSLVVHASSNRGT